MSKDSLDKLELAKRIAGLSAEKRAAFEKLLEKQGVGVAELPIVPQPRCPTGLPLSFMQQRLWFLDSFAPGIPYNIPQAFRLRGKLDVTALECSLNEIINRHEILRTTFTMDGEEPRQIVTTGRTSEIDLIDLSHMPPHKRDLEAEQLAIKEAVRSFDLATGPLIRMTLVRLADDDHMFLLTIHHIVFDGWSLDILVRELMTCYDAFAAGKHPNLPLPAIQYSDFAIWQRQHLRGTELERKIAFWKNHLDGAPGFLELPVDLPRPSQQTYNGEHLSFKLAPGLTKSLKSLCQQENVTLFMLLLAAFKVLLLRYSHQEDIVVGTPVANRERREIEDLIGFFVNTLAIRTDLSGNPSFRTLLMRIKKSSLQAFRHQELPFEKLVEEMQPERDLSRPPIFQVLFVMQNTPRISLELPGLKLDRLDINYRTSWYELSLYVWEEDGALTGALEYNTDLFEASTADRIIVQLETLLAAAAANPETRIRQLPVLPQTQRHQLIRVWNDTTARYHREKCFYELFEQQVQQTPEAIALVFEDRHITYRQLNEKANHLAHYLISLGAGPEVMAAICLERSSDMIVSLLGIMKSGSAYVPLDPSYPVDRLKYILADSEASLVITTSLLSRMLFAEETTVSKNGSPPPSIVCLDRADIAGMSASNPAGLAMPQNLAYVIYTSGSTGKPKGVGVPHRSLVNFLETMRERPGLRGSDRLLAVTTISFDIAALELYLPLLAGATLVLTKREQVSDGLELKRELMAQQITVMQATPATWRLLPEAGWTGEPALKALCGGEALPGHLAAGLLDCHLELWNMYGPTETTIWSAIKKIQRKTDINIGRPIANTTIYLLDEQYRLVPAGVHAELYIGGDGLARGYFHRPDLTAERFVPDAYGGKSGTRIYKTGDLARHVAEGEIECLGRLDNQVKVRGFRIELGEIEAVCSLHPAVDEVVAVVREDDPDNRVIAAYIVTDSQTPPSMDDMRIYLAGKLPGYMVPSAFIFLDELPLTPNGKIDRKALPAPADGLNRNGAAYTAPGTAIQQELAALWSEILKTGRVGLHDNFFNLGGHSLMATRLVSRVRNQFGVEVSLQDFFMFPTVEHQAEVVERVLMEQLTDSELDEILQSVAEVETTQA